MTDLREHLHTLGLLWRLPRLGRERLLAFQRRKLRAMLDHAYGSVPFQRDAFDRAGIHPRDIRGVPELAKLPVCDRPAVQAAPLERRLRRGAARDRLYLRSTSGMQGVPLRVARTSLEEHLLALFRHRARGHCGVRLSDRCVTVTVESGGDGRVPLPRRVADALGVWRNVTVGWRHPPGDVLRELAELRPDVLGGFPGLLCRVAEVARDPGREGPRPRLILCGAETLLPSMRRTIEDGFGAPLFDLYGAHECNLIAWQCAQTGLYHVCDDNVILEVLTSDGRPAADGALGEVVITTLHSYTMPFLRYRIGDLAVPGPAPCPCGQPYSTLRAIRGRVIDLFRLPGGRAVHAYELSQVFFGGHDAWVRRRQFVQPAEDRVVIRVAPSRPPTPGEHDALRDDFRRLLGPEVDVRVELVDELDFEPSGKFRLARSEAGVRASGGRDGPRETLGTPAEGPAG